MTRKKKSKKPHYIGPYSPIYWPKSDVRISHDNDFTAHERLEHSCMWSKQGESAAKLHAERAAKMTAEEQARKVRAFHRLAIGNFVASAVVETDNRRKREKAKHLAKRAKV